MVSKKARKQDKRQHSDLSTQPQCSMIKTLGKVERFPSSFNIWIGARDRSRESVRSGGVCDEDRRPLVGGEGTRILYFFFEFLLILLWWDDPYTLLIL